MSFANQTADIRYLLLKYHADVPPTKYDSSQADAAGTECT